MDTINNHFIQGLKMNMIEKQKFLDVVNYVKRNIDYSFECISEHLENFCYIKHIGYFEVERPNFSENKYFVIGEDNFPSFERQNDNSKDNFHYLVFQHKIFEDYLYGYVLFPLKNNKYWLIYFNL